MGQRHIVLYLIFVTQILFANSRPAIAQAAPDGVVAVAWSPDGTMIAGAGTNGFLGLWDAATGNPIFTYPQLEGTLSSVVWSPDSSKIASAGGDLIIRVWNVNDPAYALGELIASFEGHRDRPAALAWSPDGTRLASASFEEEYTLKVWDVATFQPSPVTQQRVGNLYAVAWSPNGNFIAVGSGAGLFVFDATLNIVPVPYLADYRIGPYTEVYSVSWSPDGNQIAGGERIGYDELAQDTIHIWDVASKIEAQTLTGPTNYIQSLAWSPDGTRLASASQDQMVRVWSVTTGKSLEVFENPKEVGTRAIAWSPDSQQLVFGSSRNTIMIVTLPDSEGQLPLSLGSINCFCCN